MKEIKEQPDNARRSSVMISVIGVKDRVKENFVDKSVLIGNVGGILIKKMEVVDYKSIKYVGLRNWVEIVG